MRALPTSFVVCYWPLGIMSCSGYSSRGVGHYDTTQVDTMMAVDLDSNSSGDGTYVSSWSYQNDSLVAKTQSAPNKKSQITPSNRMTIRVRYLGRVGVEACMILGDVSSLLVIVMIQLILYVSTHTEKRWGGSVISLESVNKLTQHLFKTP